MLSHRNALRVRRLGGRRVRGHARTDRLSSHAPLHFDLSVFDLFAAARAGAAVVLVPGAALALPGRARDAGSATPGSPSGTRCRRSSRCSSCAASSARSTLPDLRTILFAGEVFPTKYLRQLMELLPGVRFANLYGPTETNVCTWYEVPRWEGEPPPDPDRQADRRRRGLRGRGGRHDPRRAGEVGELFVRGPTVMRATGATRSAPSATLIRGWDDDRTGALRPTGPATSRTSTRAATGSSSAGATRRSRAAATGSSSATSRRRCISIPSVRRVRRRRRSRTRWSRTGSRRSSSPATTSREDELSSFCQRPDPALHGAGALRVPRRAPAFLDRQGRPARARRRAGGAAAKATGR